MLYLERSPGASHYFLYFKFNVFRLTVYLLIIFCLKSVTDKQNTHSRVSHLQSFVQEPGVTAPQTCCAVATVQALTSSPAFGRLVSTGIASAVREAIHQMLVHFRHNGNRF